MGLPNVTAVYSFVPFEVNDNEGKEVLFNVITFSELVCRSLGT